MTRSSRPAGAAVCLLGFLLTALLPGGCASDADSSARSAPGSGGGTSGRGGSDSAGSSGRRLAAGGNAGADAGAATNGGEGDEGGDAPGGAGQLSGGGTTSTTNKCGSDSDCVQVAGSCFVCEVSGAAKDCVDKGPPTCDNGVLEPCELCELGDVKPCVELGKAREFSGGVAKCLVTCAGWDTSSCSVCGNTALEAGEACEPGAPPAARTCADEGASENPDAVLPCTDECRFDTTLCSGCSTSALACLDGSTCKGADCNGAECKVGTRCKLDCAGGGNRCRDVRCNHDATCELSCNTRGGCAGVVCDGDATCKLHCSAGSCDDALCKSGSACSFDCHGTGSCNDITCQPGSDCDFDCDGPGPHCSGSVSCSPGKVCGFGCNDGSDCSGLTVTCPSGSACTFTCQGAGSVCPKAECLEGSSCVFSCAGGDCNSPICEEDACIGN